MQQTDPAKRKPSVRTHVPSTGKLLVGRSEAAQMLSISERALDYLVANKQLTVRRNRYTGTDRILRPEKIYEG